MMAIKVLETGNTVRQVTSRRCRVEMHLRLRVPTISPLLEQCADPAAALDRAALDPDLFAVLASGLALVSLSRCRSPGAL